MRQALGTELHPDDQKRVLASYVHRYTGDHKPGWADGTKPDGTEYQVQFADDADWLSHTLFSVRADGRLDHSTHHCESDPTRPMNSPIHGRGPHGAPEHWPMVANRRTKR